ncbi:hypothetical protein KGF56_003180 [Candida oxycetoniae]|uniref:LAA1-like C-terminal TPR repeats domain-containing protein n=1 Tax=Candida oxycetoniae TaxID=497107 RepID=A0AAI9WX76_9ASCO|nr:uncharacterized protein KGF56_003180 [Candida oxycetoniae]KAI3404021.2 hypothetical protein KGF56_003180 [Candida oxycetoniae]
MDRFNELAKRFDNEEMLTYLVDMSRKLSKEKSLDESEYHIYLGQLTQLIEKQQQQSSQSQLQSISASKKKKNDSSSQAPPPPPGKHAEASYNVFKLVSKNLVSVLRHIPSKIYDTTNSLLNFLQLSESGDLNQNSKISVFLLIDLFDNFPSSLSSLITFSVSQIYKILKKDPSVDSDLVYLLYSVSKHATRHDIDDKLNSKLTKIATKAIMQELISFDVTSDKGTSTVLLKKNYILVLKNMLLLSVSGHYEALLAMSARSGSAGAKMKPETIMSQQHQYQQALLASNEAVFDFCLRSRSQEIRIAIIDLIANLLINFILVGDFQPIEYLINAYPLPSANFKDSGLQWNLSFNGEPFAENKADTNNIASHDSESILSVNLETNLYQSSIITCIIFYLQMEQYQNPEFLSANLTDILTLILLKFSNMDCGKQSNFHVQNTDWIKTVSNWKILIEFVVKEAGSSVNDVLSEFLQSKLSNRKETGDEVLETNSLSKSKSKKRESKIFGLMSTKTFQKRGSTNSTINIYTNPYQAYFVLLLIRILIPTGLNLEDSEKSKPKTKAKEKEREKMAEDKNGKAPEAKSIDDELEITKSSDELQSVSILENVLLVLIANDNVYTRNYAIEALLELAQFHQANVNQLILSCFRLVDQEQKHSSISQSSTSITTKNYQNICGISAVRLLSYSLALSSIIKQTDPALLQNTVIVKILSFCTQTLKHSKNHNQNSSCWVILSSLVSLYKFSEYVRLNSSQFLVFWKSLLTSQYINTSVEAKSSSKSHTNDIIANLKLRTLALTCLYNYLTSVDLTPESLKQIHFMLTKSYNYLSHLESSIESVGLVTALNGTGFNESNYDPNMVNNILYSNYFFNGQLPSEKIITSLVFYSKKVLLQSYAKLATFLKSEINSNIVIFVIKMFSDHRLFARDCSVDHEKVSRPKSKSSNKSAVESNDVLVYLNEDYNYAFGLTSLFSYKSFIIDEQSRNNNGQRENIFAMRAKPLSDEKKEQCPSYYWFEIFEYISYLSNEHSLNNDPNYFQTLQSDSDLKQTSPNLTTSLVDSSILLFQLSFPHLSTKIQFSLLEQIKNSLTAKPIDQLRLKAIQVNVSIALNGVVHNAVRNSLKIEKEILSTIVDIIKNINTQNDQMMQLNSSTIGSCTVLMSTDDVHGLITNLVNEIVTHENTYIRGFAILILSKIYFNTKIGFRETYNILLQLINDTNPVIYHYTLESLVNVFEITSNDKLSLIPQILAKLSQQYLNNSFSYDVSNKALVNLKTRYGYMKDVSHLLKLFVMSLGPLLREWNEKSKTQLRNLIICLTHGIGLATLSDYVQVYKQLMELFQELVIFDPNFIEEEVELFVSFLNLIISKNLKISIASVPPTALNTETIFPFNTSFDLYSAAYECYYELLKIYGVKILSQETEYLLWVSMNIMPCPELERLIILWLESSLEKNWFGILNSLFKSSLKKLVGPFLKSNYQQKLLPLLQRQKNSSASSGGIDFKDEENEVIVGENDETSSEKNEPISWTFKLFLFEALNHLMSLAYKNHSLVERLKSRIPDIVKLSFLGSTSSITELKIKGLDLLNSALELFGELEDPLYPSVSILEQQQAQIISALVPCFTPGNDYKVIIHAIRVSSNFINLPRIKFYSKQRILKTLIQLLEEISSNKFLKFGFLETMSEFGKKSIQLSILNCWAVLKIETYDDPEGTEAEFKEILDKYSQLLTSLWILSLKEYSVIKYSESSSRELEMHGDYWINLVSVLSLESEEDYQRIDKILSGDGQTFFFILFSQCIESLIRGKNVSQILRCLQKLVRSSPLVDLIFNEQIFGEVIVVFDRLMLIDDEAEVQCLLLETLETIFETFVATHRSDLETGFDKLYELIRVTMLPLFRILPFLKSNYDASDATYAILIKHAESAPNLLVLKKSFESLTKMISLFPDLVKPDLYSCLLFLFAKIYESKKMLLISVVIPHLKQIVVDSKRLGSESVETFYSVVSQFYEIDPELTYTAITATILVTGGGVQLKETEAVKLDEALFALLKNNETASLALQCIKSLVQNSTNTNGALVVKKLFSRFIKIISGVAEKEGQDQSDCEIDLKIITEILMLFTKTIPDDETKKQALYSIFIPVLVKNEVGFDADYLQDKLMYLAKQDSNIFKQVVNKNLTPKQKKTTEDIMKRSYQVVKEDEHLPEIELRKFD